MNPSARLDRGAMPPGSGRAPRRPLAWARRRDGLKLSAVAVLLGLVCLTSAAYERLQGPTEVLYWNRAQTCDGYTFFGSQGTTYLLDMEGRVVHTWSVGASPRLLDNGHVLDASGSNTFVELDWDGRSVWSHTESRAGYFTHGDFLRIYNPALATNTTLYVANKSVSSAACIAAGCDPAGGPYANVTVDAVVEVDPAGAVVWEWCFFDHGCQNLDAGKPAFVTSISNAPGRINLNLPGRPLTNDWLHCVSLDYNQVLDQIVIAAEGGEFYVIDHGGTFVAGNPAGSIAAAAGPVGDFLYRFGDPARYGAGSPPSVQLNWSKSSTGNKQIGGVGQVAWVPTNVPGAGRFLVFNSGQDLFETTPQSYIFEVDGTLGADGVASGTYVDPLAAGYTVWAAPGHDTDKEKKSISRQVVGTFMSMANQAFFSHAGGSAQRLTNGNLFVCAAAEGHLFEVTPSSNVVWEYVSPVTATGVVAWKRDDWPLCNAVTRAARYAASSPPLAGRTLTAGATITGGDPAYLSAPVISGTARSPEAPGASNTVTVTASVTNARVVAGVTLTYIAAGVTGTAAMAESGAVYRAAIPAFGAGTSVRYYVTARDDFDLWSTDPSGAPGLSYSYTVSSNAWAAVPCEVLLGRPTDCSIAVSLLASNEAEAYVEYGAEPGSYGSRSSNAVLAAGLPGVVEIDGLQADRHYYYRLRFRGSGDPDYAAGEEHTFRTRRAPGGAFTFDVEADPHYLDPNSAISQPLWQRALTNVLADQPDFLFDLGDTFMDEKLGVTDRAGVIALRREARAGFFGIVGHSVPVFLAGGNHDAELGWLLDGTADNLAVWGAEARRAYYPCPEPSAFYSGRAGRDGFYAFSWGDALFVVLDPFWHTDTKPGIAPDVWGWTLGTNQYAWLSETLAASEAPFKFVFTHHLVGGSTDGAGRGGLEAACYGEWGGCNPDGSWGFADRRPGWAMPIETLLLANGVTAVFHGHDHLFVRQERDADGDGIADLIYQACPQPSATGYDATGSAESYGYESGVVLGNSGHLRVTVTPSNATVAYVRAYLPGDEGGGRTNGAASYAYTIGARGAWTMARLPDTGQATSYTATAGEDSDYAINAPAFADGGDGTVRDSVTGLSWQKADAGEMTWSNAIAYAVTNRLGGYSDWRLPTSHEAFSMLNHGAANPAVDTSVFTASSAQYWWTADARAGDQTRIWAINAGGGLGAHRQDETVSAGGTNRYHARCVRGGSPLGHPVHHFTNNLDGTATDLDTGLTWQRAEAGGAMAWEDALRYAEGLELAGRTDWRLPNVKELQSVNDEALSGPSVDTNVFPGAAASPYWSSTTVPNLTNRAWFVDFQYGLVSYADKAGSLRVRCVRGGAVAGPPAITAVTLADDPGGNAAWITARVVDDGAVGAVMLYYGTGSTASATNTVFLETMATNAAKPWTGAGCDHPWSVTSAGINPFEQRAGANYGAGNTNGLEFKNGTSNLADSVVASSNAIDAAGSAAAVGFYVAANNQRGTAGWAFQVDSGTGFVTRLSEFTGSNHAWQAYRYDLQPSELVSGMRIRFQFAGGLSTNRVDLDRVSVTVVAAGSSSTGVPMADDGLHGDGEAGDGIYGAEIPAQAPGTRVSYYITATDDSGLAATNPAAAPGDSHAYYALDAPNLVLGRPTGGSIAVNALADADMTVCFGYGTQSTVYAGQTAPTNLSAGSPGEIELSGLVPGTRYYYRPYYKAAGEALYHSGPERTFHTWRAPASRFTFCVQGDSHPERAGSQFDGAFYSNTLLAAAADEPDFYLAMGDDFSVDLIPTNLISRALVAARYELQRPYLALVGGSAPLFLVNGNHEQAAAYLLDGTSNNIAVWAQNARNAYYPEPAPDGFYSGNTNAVAHVGLLRNYYAWTWGDALFVTLDPYWASPVCVDANYWTGTKRTNLWDVTHGDAQYQWLKATLEQSDARFKFVFAHHVLGTGRGGIDEAGGYEWGGLSADSMWGFGSNRSGWALPIHQLMATNHVTVFFQGHDHLFAREELDGVTYLTVPEPADPTRTLWNADSYTQAILVTNNTGYVRVSVGDDEVVVSYVRTCTPAEAAAGMTNGLVDCSFAIRSPAVGGISPGGGGLCLSFHGTVHQVHSVQAARDLVAGDWTTILNTNVSATPFTWTDPGADGYRRRFYRLRYGP